MVNGEKSPFVVCVIALMSLSVSEGSVSICSVYVCLLRHMQLLFCGFLYSAFYLFGGCGHCDDGLYENAQDKCGDGDYGTDAPLQQLVVEVAAFHEYDACGYWDGEQYEVGTRRQLAAACGFAVFRVLHENAHTVLFPVFFKFYVVHILVMYVSAMPCRKHAHGYGNYVSRHIKSIFK